MIKIILKLLLIFILLIFETPSFANDISPKIIETYNLRIARKFSKTYCNTSKFGISTEGALNFAIGETNKEFLNNKLNKFIDYEVFNKNIIVNLKNNCNVYDFPLDQLENLIFN